MLTPGLSRRGFLAGMLALGAAPAIVTSKGFRALHQPHDFVIDLGGGGKTAFISAELGRYEGIRIIEGGLHPYQQSTIDRLRAKAKSLAPRPGEPFIVVVHEDWLPILRGTCA